MQKIFLKEGDLLKIASDTELLPDKLEEPVIPTSNALYQSIIKNKKPVIIPDARDIPDVMPWNLDIRLRSLLVAPLIDREEIIGLMVLGNVQSDYYQIEDVERVIAFVNQAASAIVKSRLFTETRKRLKNLQTLHNIDQLITASVDIRMTLDILLEQVVSSLGVDAAAILLYRSNTQMLEYVAGKGIEVHRRKKMHQKLGEGPAGKAALEREIVLRFSTENPIEHPINLSRTNQLFHFYSAVPLYAKGQIKGVLEIFNQTAFDPDNEWMDFLNALATQAALAIDNQELFNDLQRTNNNLMLAYDLTLEGWARALELRDQETEGHSQRVVKLTVELGRALHLSEKRTYKHSKRRISSRHRKNGYPR